MRNTPAVLAGLAALGLTVLGCGGKAAAPKPTTNPAVATLRTRAGLADGRSFVGTYALTSPAGAALATVRVYLDPAAYRVDVVEKAATTSLYGGTGRETVACTVAASIPTVCYDVAPPGAAVPTRFDIGVERLFRTDLPALAASSGGITVATTATDAGLTDVAPGTSCFVVGTGTAADAPDAGTYCLDPAGLLVGFASTSGVLRLTSHSTAPTARDLAVPAKPQPLPASASSPSPSS